MKKIILVVILLMLFVVTSNNVFASDYWSKQYIMSNIHKNRDSILDTYSSINTSNASLNVAYDEYVKCNGIKDKIYEETLEIFNSIDASEHGNITTTNIVNALKNLNYSKIENVVIANSILNNPTLYFESASGASSDERTQILNNLDIEDMDSEVASKMVRLMYAVENELRKESVVGVLNAGSSSKVVNTYKYVLPKTIAINDTVEAIKNLDNHGGTFYGLVRPEQVVFGYFDSELYERYFENYVLNNEAEEYMQAGIWEGDTQQNVQNYLMQVQVSAARNDLSIASHIDYSCLKQIKYIYYAVNGATSYDEWPGWDNVLMPDEINGFKPVMQYPVTTRDIYHGVKNTNVSAFLKEATTFSTLFSQGEANGIAALKQWINNGVVDFTNIITFIYYNIEYSGFSSRWQGGTWRVGNYNLTLNINETFWKELYDILGRLTNNGTRYVFEVDGGYQNFTKLDYFFWNGKSEYINGKDIKVTLSGKIDEILMYSYEKEDKKYESLRMDEFGRGLMLANYGYIEGFASAGKEKYMYTTNNDTTITFKLPISNRVNLMIARFSRNTPAVIDLDGVYSSTVASFDRLCASLTSELDWSVYYGFPWDMDITNVIEEEEAIDSLWEYINKIRIGIRANQTQEVNDLKSSLTSAKLLKNIGTFDVGSLAFCPDEADVRGTCNDGWWECAFQFFKTGESSGGTDISTEALDDIQEMVFYIGNIIFIVITASLGVKYIWGSVESKASVKNSLFTLVVAALVFYGWNSINELFDIRQILTGTTASGGYEGVAKQIYSIILYIINFLAIGGIIYIGIKYMLAGADGKAEMKVKLLPAVLGIIMVYGTIQFINFMLSIAGII